MSDRKFPLPETTHASSNGGETVLFSVSCGEHWKASDPVLEPLAPPSLSYEPSLNKCKGLEKCQCYFGLSVFI